MERLWDSDLDLVVSGDFIYLPLLYDPSIAREAAGFQTAGLPGSDPPPIGNPLLIQARGSLWVKTVSLTSLTKNYAVINPLAWEEVRRSVLPDAADLTSPRDGLPDPPLAVILFQVMPHFLRRSGTFTRETLNREDILRMIAERVPVPSSYCGRSADLGKAKHIREAIRGLEKLAVDPDPSPKGFMPAKKLHRWFCLALIAEVARREQVRLTTLLAEQKQWADLQARYGGLLAYLAEKGSLEIDGFGFSRLRSKNDYRIYKRTGVYALKDFYGRPYIFPDCRVAVSTTGRLKPFVIEHYKHPLLRRHGPGQEICLPKDFQASATFSPGNVIQSLETGINALYFGYNARRRNGYHSLDRIHQERFLDFDDYRTPPDDPRIVSGEVEVKNTFL